MSCLLENGIDENCAYTAAGATRLALINYYPPVFEVMAALPEGGLQPQTGKIVYAVNTAGKVLGMALPGTENAYEIKSNMNTVSFTDQLQATGNGGKFRIHTVNASIGRIDATGMGGIDAISLGTFVAVVVSRNGDIVILGIDNGLKAAANGVDYASGAAAADANGWTLILAGEQPASLKLADDAVLDVIAAIEP